MITNADITIYNVLTDKETHLPTYHRTHIKGVHWYTDQKINVDSNGAHSADVFKIRIPEDAKTEGKRYVSPDKYQALDNVSGVWTIQNGDVFVKGIVMDDITKQSDILDKYKDISGRVNSWSDNRFGGLSHWRIGGGC